jgi:U6 snRNA-associated Sm-like protein LSm3
LNLVLGNVEETVELLNVNFCFFLNFKVNIETNEQSIETKKRKIPMLFVRGDGIILISPPIRT